jgi:flagellar motor switch protein FliN
MPNIPQSLLDQLSTLQPTVWSGVSALASEAANAEVKFTDALTLSTTQQDLFAEMGSPKLVIQFSFSDQPMSQQVLLMNNNAVTELATHILGAEQTGVDESLLGSLRPFFEAIVQGLCQGVGSVKNETVVVSGLSIRYQMFNFPANFHNSPESLRVNVTIETPESRGSLTWLFDEDTARFITGEQAQDENGPLGAKSAEAHREGSGEVDTQLELLLDIPLEISVELGRKKMLVRDVVELAVGSIIELDKTAGEPVDVLVNGKLVARGEVVVIEDNFGVRITEILTPQERLQRLGDAA